MTTVKPIRDAERNAATDPYIPMRPVRLHFVNPRWSFITSINGTRDEIANYYCGAKLNLGFEANGKEWIQTPHRIDFLPKTAGEGEKEISYTLPEFKTLLYREYRIAFDGYGYGFAHTGYDGAEDSNDGRCGHCQSIEECKRVIDEQIEDAQWSE